MILFIFLFILKLCLSQYTVTFMSQETGEPIIVYNKDYLYSMYTKEDKIKHIFDAIDVDKNYFLSYDELEFYQRITDPQLLLTRRDYLAICKMTHANYRYGLDYYQFSNTYYELSDILGTNITKDFNIIIRLQSVKSY